MNLISFEILKKELVEIKRVDLKRIREQVSLLLS